MKNLHAMRPEGIYDEILKQREIDGRSFFLRHHEEFSEVRCPACGQEGRVAFKKYGFTHKKCSGCDTLFCSPRPGEGLLRRYYAEYEAPRMWNRLLLESDNERKVLQYGPRVEKILGVLADAGFSKGGKALDIGSGTGAFALCLKRRGFFGEVFASDFSEECVRECRKAGLNATTQDVSEMCALAFDLVCMNDVLEHIYDPAGFLRNCKRVLAKNGCVAIGTPNGEGFDFKIFKEETGNITPPEHLNYFNPISIEILLHKCGFEPLLTVTPGKLDVEIVLNRRSRGYSLRENNEYLDFLLGQDEVVLERLQGFLSENKLSSHMLVIARKKESSQSK